MSTLRNERVVRAPRGLSLSAKSWQTEAPLRMLMNNLDPEVAERPDDLVVYGGTGRAARSWEAFDAIVETLRDLQRDGRWKEIWRIVGEYANHSVFDVDSHDELHAILSGFPMFPYMKVRVTPLATHPNAIAEDFFTTAEDRAAL